MVGLDTWLSQLTGGNEALAMLGAAVLLIFLSFLADMAVEIKNNDLKWNDLFRFLNLVFLNAAFLFGMELMMVPALRIPLAYDVFISIQMAGWVGVMVYFFYGFYKNLKKLGMQSNRAIEEHIQNLVDPNKEDIQ